MILDFTKDEDSDITSGSGSIPAGDYQFKIDDIERKKFNSGNSGWKIVLLVGTKDRDVKVFDNLVEIESVKWKWSQFAKAFGVSQIDTGNPDVFVSKFGKARFKVGEKGYLEVDRYLEGDSPSAEQVVAQQQQVPQQADQMPSWS